MKKENYFEEIGSHVKLTVGLRAYLDYVVYEDCFKKKQIITLSNEYFSNLLFISSGTLRLCEKDEDMEATIQFLHTNQLIAQMHLLEKYTGKNLCVEFLEDSTIIGFKAKHTSNLYKLFPEYRELVNNVHQSQLAALICHTISLGQISSKGRFENLMASNPSLFNTVELKIIANYLGIHPKFLSLLRSKAVKK